MAQQKYSQTQQVIDTLRQTGGYATLGDLYHLVDTKSWTTKTPNESIRRIVQQSDEVFRIQPGLGVGLRICAEVQLKLSGQITASTENEFKMDCQANMGCYSSCTPLDWRMGDQSTRLDRGC